MTGSRVKDVELRCIVLFSIFTLLEAIQLLVLAVLIGSLIPIPLNDFVKTLLPLYWDQVRPERDLQFYAFFIACCFVIQAGGVLIVGKYFESEDFLKKLRTLVGVETFWVLAQIILSFLVLTQNQPVFRNLLYASIVFALATKFFWPEIRRLFNPPAK